MEHDTDNCVSIFSIPYELLSFIIHPSKYPLINEEMRQFKNEEITISLKKKLGKTTLNTLFITDDTKIYLSQYLDKKEILPNTDKLYQRIVRLPLHNHLSIRDIDYVCKVIKKFYH